MYHIIINPKGGKGRSLKALKVVEEKLKKSNLEYIVHETERAGHATEITRELSKEPNTNIIMMGGDGTFNEILNGVEDFNNVTLGFVPCGSGNDFIKASGHPADVEKSIDLIIKGNTQYIDYIQLDDRRCLNVLGCGMDVDVLEKYASMSTFKVGKARYFAALVSTLCHTRFHKLRFTIDNGEPIEKNVFMLGIGNGKYIGGGLPICPDGEVQDGVLSIMGINEVKKWTILGRLFVFLLSDYTKKPWALHYHGKEITIEVLDDSKFEADGEIFPAEKIHCKVISNTLKVFM